MTIIDQLEALYAQLPGINCKGLCQTCCGPIDMSIVERARIRETGYEIQPFTEERVEAWDRDEKFDSDGQPLWCNALSLETGKCQVYEVRPMVCRLWGLGEGVMSCTFGCKPTSVLSHTEMLDFLLQSQIIGGNDQMNFDDEERRHLQEFMENPVTGPLMTRYLQGDKSAKTELTRLIEGGA